jgi:X-X-X-Leu-X-X-Gly heptad repeat protein
MSAEELREGSKTLSSGGTKVSDGEMAVASMSVDYPPPRWRSHRPAAADLASHC